MAYKFLMSFLVVLLFVLTVALSEYRDNVFQEKIDQAESRLREMTAEHERSLGAAQAAMREREAILEREKDKLCRAQAAMGANSDFCNVDIPADLRLLWQGDEARVNASASNVPPAGTTPDGH